MLILRVVCWCVDVHDMFVVMDDVQAMCDVFFFFFFKQKTAYEMRISDWSSDVCSSDLAAAAPSCDCPGRTFPDRSQEEFHAQDPAGIDLPRRDGGHAPPCRNDHRLRHHRTGQHLDREGWGARRYQDHQRWVRSEERGVGKECVRTCRSRWARSDK